jgi:gamma-tubulin complex component 2
MKKYFFMQTGDFFNNFLDSAENDLDQKYEKINIERLDSLIQITLSTCSARNDNFKEDVAC